MKPLFVLRNIGLRHGKSSSILLQQIQRLFGCETYHPGNCRHTKCEKKLERLANAAYCHGYKL